MTKKQLKNLLLPVPYHIPLLVLLAQAVHILTGLSILWCVSIAFVLNAMYDVGEIIMRDEK
jgi:hypothetical protein